MQPSDFTTISFGRLNGRPWKLDAITVLLPSGLWPRLPSVACAGVECVVEHAWKFLPRICCLIQGYIPPNGWASRQVLASSWTCDRKAMTVENQAVVALDLLR